MEREFGSELQDRVRNHVRLFLRYRRQKGSSAVDHVNTFEHLLFEAELHGMRLNNILKTTMLSESAGLTDDQEGWCLQQVMGGYAQYDTIRTAFRRLTLDVPL